MAAITNRLIRHASRRSFRRSCLLSSPTPVRKYSTTFDGITSDLLSRRLPVLYDAPTETPSYLLDATLADFLPASPVSAYPIPPSRKLSGEIAPLRPGHHLVYFPPGYPLSSLLPDGTDPEQSPQGPYVRRMWAGGHIRFIPSKSSVFRLDGFKSACLERVANVSIKGEENKERIFVTIERRFSGSLINTGSNEAGAQDVSLHSEEMIRATLLDDQNCSLIEERNIVFMRERTPEELGQVSSRSAKHLKPPHEPSYSVSLTPSASLLFRFSALTFNAHRIHLDKLYCKDVEGHRNLLVHGPLSLVFMLEVLNRYLARQYSTRNHGPFELPQRVIAAVEYRNVAPLYAEEPMKVCLRDRGDETFDVWVENKDGGLAVKGTATTVQHDNLA